MIYQSLSLYISTINLMLNKYTYKVFLNVLLYSGAMYVDGQGPFQGVGPKRHQGLDLNQPLFVGGVPDFVKIHKLNGFESGFVGKKMVSFEKFTLLS